MILDFEQDEITAGGLTIPLDVPFSLPAGASYKFLAGWTWVGLGGSGVLHLKDLSDGLSLAEARAAGFGRTIPDALVLGELLAQVADYVRNLEDPTVLGEAIVAALAGAGVKSVGDPIALAEAIALVSSMFRSVSDAATLGEAFASVLAASRSASDPLTLAEVVDKLLTGAGVSPVEMDDPSFYLPHWAWTWLAAETAGGAALEKMVSDGLSLNEAIAKALVILKAVFDGLNVNEVLAKAMGFGRSATDPLTLAENVAKAAAFRRSPADALALNEVLGRIATFQRSLADVITLSDTVARSLSGAGIQTVTDALSLNDVLTKIATLQRSRSDALSLGETILKQIVLGLFRTDPIALADVIDVALVIGPSIPGGTGGYKGGGYVVFDEALPELAPKEGKPWPSDEERAIIAAIVNFVTGGGK